MKVVLDIIKTGVELIAEERQSHFSIDGFVIKNEIIDNGDIVKAAAWVLTLDGNYYQRRWGQEWLSDKIAYKTNVERLVIAGALIAAEIDRLQNTNP